MKTVSFLPLGYVSTVDTALSPFGIGWSFPIEVPSLAGIPQCAGIEIELIIGRSAF